MGEEKSAPTKPGGEGNGSPPASGDDAAKATAEGFASKVGNALIPIFITGSSLLGFVAFSGAVVLWTRFTAVEVPPERAIDLAPQGELVAIGSVFLLLFGFFGALALMGAFLVDRGARPTPGMARTLLTLLAVEGLTAIAFVEGLSTSETLIAAELFLLPLAAAALATTMSRFGVLVDDLKARRRESLEPKPREGLLRPGEARTGTGEGTAVKERVLVLGPFALVALAMVVAALDIFWWDSASLLLWLLSGAVVVFVLWVIGLAIGDAAAVREARRQRDRKKATDRERREREEQRPINRCARWLRRWRECHHPPVGGGKGNPDPGKDEDPAPKKDGDADPAEDKRRNRSRPLRLSLNLAGIALIGVLMIAAVVLPWQYVGTSNWWLPVALAVAALVTAALWRVAYFANARLVWFGVAIFLSVPLFGTVGAMVSNLNHPKVQPMALIRETDGPREAIQGIYVTETSDTIYFANVATEGCGEEVTPHSGRLLSVPSDEVVAMSLGPAQLVGQAGKAALEMSYALTPSIETPQASVELPGDRARAKKAEEEQEKASWHDTRLENAGPAVRPNFGSGLRLEPEQALPGESVNLRLSKPNDENDVEGFGQMREGHNLRIGGEVANIAKEPAGSAEGAEYIELGNRLVGLARGGPYVSQGSSGYKPLDEVDDAGPKRFVKIEDANVRAVHDKPLSEDNAYVEVDEAGPGVKIARGGPEVTLAGGTIEGKPQQVETIALGEKTLSRQAWHPEYIRFIVPEDAKTGVVSVECDQLAGSPLLQVARPPTARIAVHMRPNSAAVTLDSGSSRDEDEIPVKDGKSGKTKPPGSSLKRRWTVEGAAASHRRTTTALLPPRLRPYSIELTVTDESGNSDSATLKLLRLPTSLFAFNHSKPQHPKAIRKAREAMERAVAVEKPVAVELDGHADNPGSAAYNLNLSLKRDDHVRKALLQEKKPPEAGAPTVPVEELAYGESCQLDKRAGRRPLNRRVDVFVLNEGVTVRPPKGCHPGRLKSMRWHLEPPSQPEQAGE